MVKAATHQEYSRKPTQAERNVKTVRSNGSKAQRQRTIRTSVLIIAISLLNGAQPLQPEPGGEVADVGCNTAEPVNNAQTAPGSLANAPPMARAAEGELRKQPLRKGKGRRVDLNEVPDSDLHCKVLPSRAVAPDHEIASQENDEGCGCKLPGQLLESSGVLALGAPVFNST